MFNLDNLDDNDVKNLLKKNNDEQTEENDSNGSK